MKANNKSIVHEIDFFQIDNPKDLVKTLAAEAILFGTLKASINKLITRSKLDLNLTKHVYSISNIKRDIRIIPDSRVYSFDSGDVIWLSDGLVDILNSRQLTSIILHEIGHGREKVKILYNQLTRSSKRPNKLKPLYKALAYLIEKKGIRSDDKMKMKVYMMTYIVYISSIGDPFRGLYKWSYGDLAIRHGYWDEYESSLKIINRYIDKHPPSDIVEKLTGLEKKHPGSVNGITKSLNDNMGSNNTNPQSEIQRLSNKSTGKINGAMIGKFLRTVF
jgi:hypothetical protein